MASLLAIPFLLASLLAPAATDADETILIWSDHARDGNPVFVAFRDAGEWSVEPFSPSAPFDDNYSPCLAFGPDGTPWVAWAASRGTGTPAICQSRLSGSDFWAGPATDRPAPFPGGAPPRRPPPRVRRAGVPPASRLACVRWRRRKGAAP